MAEASNARAAFVAADHDHDHCITSAMDAASALCARRGARLTAQRRRVLELVWRSHAPQGAYAILETLYRDGHPAAPPTVYRALDFLLAQGLIHRIESLNAFVGCPTPHTSHPGHFLICDGCGAAAEVNDRRLRAAIRRSAGDIGFKVERQTIELRGLCPECQDTGPEPAYGG